MSARRRRFDLAANCGDDTMLPVSTSFSVRVNGLNQLLNRWMWKRDRVIARREFDALIDDIARDEHRHCECRTRGCGHLDLRHARGSCSFPGCTCEEWS